MDSIKEILQKISDSVADQMAVMEDDRLHPVYVIVGCAEYEALIAEIREHSVMLPGGYKEEGLSVLGCRVIPDFQSSSRITVTHEVGYRSYRMRKRAGLRTS